MQNLISWLVERQLKEQDNEQLEDRQILLSWQIYSLKRMLMSRKIAMKHGLEQVMMPYCAQGATRKDRKNALRNT